MLKHSVPSRHWNFVIVGLDDCQCLHVGKWTWRANAKLPTLQGKTMLEIAVEQRNKEASATPTKETKTEAPATEGKGEAVAAKVEVKEEVKEAPKAKAAASPAKPAKKSFLESLFGK